MCLPFKRSLCGQSRLYLPNRGFRQRISRRMVGNTETMRLPFPIHLKGVFGIPPKTHSANPLDVPGRDFTQ